MPKSNPKKVSTIDKQKYQEDAEKAALALIAQRPQMQANREPVFEVEQHVSVELLSQQDAEVAQHNEETEVTIDLEPQRINTLHERKLAAINKILENLSTDINSLLLPQDSTDPSFQEDSVLIKASRRLLAEFHVYKITYGNGKAENITELRTLDSDFINKCSDGLKQNKGLLQADLGYWDSFVNALKSLIKTICRIPDSIGFFKPAQTPTMSTFSNAQDLIALRLKLCEDYEAPSPTQ